jgi:sterol desaturase/sphingolipid hydroxylase (fatty acid hydroxylase superfamily)
LPEHQDKNFADALPIFDIIFGTYHRPALDEFPHTGLYSGEPPPTRWWRAQVEPVVGLFRWQRETDGNR